MRRPRPLLTIRTALVLALATLTASGAALLTRVQGAPTPICIVVFATTWAAATTFFDQLIDST